jgi:hypothetical protein
MRLNKTFHPADSADLDDYQEDVDAEQMGHSKLTRELNYAVHALGDSGGKMFAAYLCCVKFNNMIRSGVIDTVTEEAKALSRRTPSSSVSPNESPPTSFPLSSYSSVVSHGTSLPLEKLIRDFKFQFTSAQVTQVLLMLRKVLENKDATFLNDIQQQMFLTLTYSLESVPKSLPSDLLIDVLLIAPTALGKSLGTIISTMINNKVSKKVDVFICPTVALLSNMKARFEKAQLKVCTLSSNVHDEDLLVNEENISSFQTSVHDTLANEMRSCDILLMLPEDTSTERVIKSLREISSSIRRVFFDEAQLIVKWRFRKYLEAIVFFRRLNNSIQCVFLSGSFPIHFEEIFLGISDLRHVKIIRYNCDRPNIGYSKLEARDGPFKNLIEKGTEVLDNLPIGYLNDKKVTCNLLLRL